MAATHDESSLTHLLKITLPDAGNGRAPNTITVNTEGGTHKIKVPPGMKAGNVLTVNIKKTPEEIAADLEEQFAKMKILEAEAAKNAEAAEAAKAEAEAAHKKLEEAEKRAAEAEKRAADAEAEKKEDEGGFFSKMGKKVDGLFKKSDKKEGEGGKKKKKFGLF